MLTILASIYEYLLKRSSSNDNSVNTTKNGDEINNNNNYKKNNNNDNNQQTTVNVDNENENNIISTKSSPKHSIISRIIIAFSFVSNLRSLFISKPNNFGSIDFLRLLMLFETIFMHTYYIGILMPGMAIQKKLLTGLASKTLREKQYGFLRNFHNTDFFFALR